MSHVNLLDFIDAVSMGEVSFSTLRNVSVDGDIISDNSFFYHRGFAVIRIRINNDSYKLKVAIDQSDNTLDFFKSIDRCNTFYSNIFVEMTPLFGELTVLSEYKTHKLDAVLIDNRFHSRIVPKLQYLKGFITLTSLILKTRIAIDKFSLKWCINDGQQLRVSLEKGGCVLAHKQIAADMLIAFKNYLLSLISYIANNYCEDNFEHFLEQSPVFNAKNYLLYNQSSFIESLIPAVDFDSYNTKISDLLTSTNRKYCAEILINEVDNLSEDSLVIRTKPDKIALINNKEIIGENQENRIAIKDLSDGKIGFINESCEVVIPFDYDTVTDFEEGVSVVSKDGLFGALNLYGETLIPFDYDDLCWCVDYNLFIYTSNGMYGLTNRVGEVILESKYQWIDSFHKSLARFQDDSNKIGFLSPLGNIVIEAKWDDATSFVDGVAKVRLDNNWYAIDVEGEII